MEPKLPMPSPSPEMGGYKRRETQPAMPEQVSQPNVEAQPIPEREPQLEAQQHIPVDPATIPALPAHLVQVTSHPQQTPQNTTSSSDNPIAANDDDLIEKEWVDKAKKIVQQTKSDPYLQEKEVSRLQADYIKKRYGKDVRLPNE